MDQFAPKHIVASREAIDRIAILFDRNLTRKRDKCCAGFSKRGGLQFFKAIIPDVTWDKIILLPDPDRPTQKSPFLGFAS